MNNQNLTQFQYRSGSEAREKGRKGGKASGKARAKKRTVREAFSILRGLPLDDEKLRARLEKAGIEDGDITYGVALAYMTAAHAMKGNPAMMRLAFEMMGENDVQGVTKLPAGGKLDVHFSTNPEDFK